MWRRFFIALALFIALIVASTHALHSARFAELLRGRIQSWASARLHQPVSVGGLKIELVPPALLLEQVDVTPSPTGVYTLHVLHARVQPRPWPSPHGALVLAALALDGVTGTLPVDLSWLIDAATPQGASQPSALGHNSAKATRPWPLDIQHLSIENAGLTLTQGENWITLAGVTVLMRPAAVSGRHLTVDVLQIAAYLPNVLQGKSPHVLSLHLQGSLIGTLDHRRYLHLEMVQANSIGMTAPSSRRYRFRVPAHPPAPWQLAGPSAKHPGARG